MQVLAARTGGSVSLNLSLFFFNKIKKQGEVDSVCSDSGALLQFFSDRWPAQPPAGRKDKSHIIQSDVETVRAKAILRAD